MKTTKDILLRANAVKYDILKLTTKEKNETLKLMAQCLLDATDEILSANQKDVEAAKDKISDVMIDRLMLSADRIEGMAKGILEVAELPDPVGRVIDEIKRPNGLAINKVSVPLGVVAIIYESRPNVTSDAAALAFKSGNVCILRGGKEAYNSSAAVVKALRSGLKKCGLPEDYIQLVEDTTRDSAYELMTATGLVDLLIPRGGAGLIKACVENAKVPCIETGTGICHIYVDKAADLEKALNILDNAKTSRPSVCNAAEVCLVNSTVAEKFLPMLYERLVAERQKQGKTPVELRLCEKAIKYINGILAADSDFDTEFLDYILAIKVVESVEEAICHIREHSTRHSEAIITEDETAALKFTRLVDSAAVYVNASTRFTDGGEFGLGCEMGISTGRLHARGPMGLCELNTYKYVINGNGQIR